MNPEGKLKKERNCEGFSMFQNVLKYFSNENMGMK